MRRRFAPACIAAPVPDTDADHSFIYSVVFDSDGDPSNDWTTNPPYDCDHFQGADRWYQCIYDHSFDRWSVTVTRVDSSQNTTEVLSTASCVIEKDTLTWCIGWSELPASTVRYRVSSFGHDGSWSASDRGGDVSGDDPTEPLSEL